MVILFVKNILYVSYSVTAAKIHDSLLKQLGNPINFKHNITCYPDQKGGVLNNQTKKMHALYA